MKCFKLLTLSVVLTVSFVVNLSAQNVTKPNFLKGCVGLWSYRGNGNVSVTGTVNDGSGNGSNGTLYNNAFIDNQGLNLDGSSDADCGNNSIFNIVKEFTMLCWVKFSSVSGYAGIMGKNYGGDSTGYIMCLYNNGKISGWINAGGFKLAVASETVTTGVWYHAGMVYNGATLKIYINGEWSDGSSPSATANITNSSTNFKIGVYQSSADYRANAIIDDIRVYNRALSAAEIKQIYHATKGFHQ